MLRHWLLLSLIAATGLSPLALSEGADSTDGVDTLSAIDNVLQSGESEALSLNAVFPFWYEPAEPFRVIGNVYFVGSRGLAMFFIPTAEGHILIDGGVPENAAMIADSIRKLGYRPEDIKLLLNTHAHLDHSGGLAELKAISGAQLLASEGDRSALESGKPLGSEDEVGFWAPPVAVDAILDDGEVVTVGEVSLTAHLTPGHTRGCTSWQLTVNEGDIDYDVLIFCSASISVNRLVDPVQYPGIVEAYRSTFRRVASWQPDVFLANHPEFFGLEEKRVRSQAGDALAFVDDKAFSVFLKETESAFEAGLEKQRRAATER